MTPQSAEGRLSTANSGASELQRTPEPRKRTVFVAISDREDRDYVTAMLETDGFDVWTFSDGYHLVEHIAEAIEDDSKPRPKLIIADAILPGCTGISLLSGLRDLNWQTPIVLLAERNQHLKRSRAWNYGVTAIFNQPFDIDELCSFASLVMTPESPEEEEEARRLARGTGRYRAPDWVEESRTLRSRRSGRADGLGRVVAHAPFPARRPRRRNGSSRSVLGAGLAHGRDLVVGHPVGPELLPQILARDAQELGRPRAAPVDTPQGPEQILPLEALDRGRQGLQWPQWRGGSGSHLVGKVLGTDLVGALGLGEDDCMLDGVLELAHVAGKIVVAEQCPGFRWHRRSMVARQAADEMRDQERDVALSLTKWRQRDMQHFDAKVQVFTEALLVDQVLETPIGRRDDSNVEGLDLVGSQWREALFLQDAKQLGLAHERHVADLVEKECPALCRREASQAPLVGAGKRAPLVTEELGLEKSVGKRRAIDGHEGPFVALAALVQRSRDELLARATLAAEQNRCIAGPHGVDLFAHGDHLG